MRHSVELLAPAGSYESLVAAVNAGADAVYIGGTRFGARAYADNLEEDTLCKAIRYAHLHDCDLYLTEQLDRNEDGKSQRNYRLHARAAHTPEMALAYEIKCPKCGNTLKQIARQRTLTDLGLYTCKCCNK